MQLWRGICLTVYSPVICQRPRSIQYNSIQATKRLQADGETHYGEVLRITSQLNEEGGGCWRLGAAGRVSNGTGRAGVEDGDGGAYGGIGDSDAGGAGPGVAGSCEGLSDGVAGPARGDTSVYAGDGYYVCTHGRGEYLSLIREFTRRGAKNSNG